MSPAASISLFTAILININTIMGAGIFVNLSALAQLVGPFGFLSYLVGGIIFIPIVLCIAALAAQLPVAGGLFVYSQTYLGPTAGFLACWSYFIGKVTSAALLIHTFSSFMVNAVPFLQGMPPLAFDAIVLATLIAANYLGVRIGGKIQYLFISFKGMPILIAALASVACFSWLTFSTESLTSSGFIASLPVVAFAFTGFEVVCAITHLLHDSANNARKAILRSFFAVIGIYVLFQLLIAGALGATLATTTTPIKSLLLTAIPSMPWLARLINAMVFTSIIGGAFSNLTSNCWNLHVLAKQGMLPFSRLLTSISVTQVPWVSLIIEGLLALLILSLCHDQIPLQNMFVLCIVGSFLLTVCAAIVAGSQLKLPRFVPWLAALSCCYLIGIAVNRLVASGLSLAFMIIFSIGLLAGASVFFKRHFS